ncbi:helix-turn-helix domain-containing protein [Halorubellus sp. JP-L1]|uniref:helix-turn-helix domain-containing protein n=1 Tax=Halorubellus sp. JP-L1 TaxID=2715753 RepID=UPI00140ADAEF|nr:helix-turn-helix domain-containing protein [Halorubellus sp. JP-L1]NHN42771.1 helix-turn-helix domain-containing protein [Halorubellus sp. JP-L1]
MPNAKLELTVPEGIWLGRVTRAHPETRIRVLAAIPDGLTGVGLIEIDGDATDAVLGTMEGEDDITSIDVLQHGDDEALVQFETADPLLLMPARGSGVPLEMPFDIRDGTVTWEVTASTDQLSRLGEQLEEFGIPFHVVYVRQETDRRRLLTERQRDLLDAAVDAGYYDTPRECSLTDLADRVGIAKSTCSSTLHRAEEAIVKDFVQHEDVDDLARP